jgi:hypothetical protein
VRRVLPFLLPAAVLVAFTVALARADRFPGADGPHMLGQGMRLGRWIAEGRWGQAWDAFVGLVAPHPPLGYVPLALVSVVVRDVRWVVALSAAVWAGLLLDGACRLVRPAPVWAGPLAWGIGMASAPLWWSADHAGFDLVAAAATVQALAWLHASEGFARRRESALFGAWLGAAFLSKYTAPLVLALPVAWAGVSALAGRGASEGVSARRTNLALAVAAWAVLWVPWAAHNGEIAVRYVASALAPPAGPGFFPEERTLLQRVSGEGQVGFLAVLEVALGGPILVLGAASAIRERRVPVLLALVGGLLALGAMNAREARYALPLVVLFPIAAVPSRGERWREAAVLGGLALPMARGTWSWYRGCDRACAPSVRELRVDRGELTRTGAWPTPALAFQPISEHPERMAVDEALVEARALAGEAPLAVLVDALDSRGATMWQLEAEARGWDLDMVSVAVRLTPDGRMEEARFRGPFPGGWSVEPRAALVVSLPSGGSRAAAWASAHGWTPSRTWDVPGGTVGLGPLGGAP